MFIFLIHSCYNWLWTCPYGLDEWTLFPVYMNDFCYWNVVTGRKILTYADDIVLPKTFISNLLFVMKPIWTGKLHSFVNCNPRKPKKLHGSQSLKTSDRIQLQSYTRMAPISKLWRNRLCHMDIITCGITLVLYM